MTLEQFVQYLMSFLGGGFAVAVGNWVNSSIGARRQREIDHLKGQLQSLYGPLSFFTQQNEKLFALCGAFNAAYTAEFAAKNWAQDERTQATVRADAGTTIDLSNQYIKRVVENNNRVMEILEKGWYLADGEDIEELSQFQVDFTRFKTEVEGKLKTPFAIYKAVGDVSYMRPSMIELVKRKVRVKEERVRELMRPWWCCDG
jgi:hypothetical protein